MSGQEKRRYVRIDFERQVQLSFFTEVYDNCQVKNISLGGMFVEGSFPYKTDDQCQVKIAQTSKSASLKLKALAKVIRRDDEGVALQFISMSFESLLTLEMILLFEARETSSDAEIILPENIPFEISEEESWIPDNDSSFLERT